MALAAGAQTPAVIPLESPAAAAPCGVWQMLPADAIFRIEPGDRAGCYRMVLIDSDDYTTITGATMGTMEPTATPWVYDAAIYTTPGARDSRTEHCIIKIDPEAGRLTMQPYRRNQRLSIRRWAGYLFRLTVDSPNRPDDYDGAVRLSPGPGNIVIL